MLARNAEGETPKVTRVLDNLQQEVASTQTDADLYLSWQVE